MTDSPAGLRDAAERLAAARRRFEASAAALRRAALDHVDAHVGASLNLCAIRARIAASG